MSERQMDSSGEPEDRYISEIPSEHQEIIAIVCEPHGVTIPSLAA